MSSGLLFKAWYNRTAVFAGVNGMWETVMQTLQKQRIKGTPSPPPALLNPMKRGFYIQRRNSECPVLFGHNMSSPFTSRHSARPSVWVIHSFLKLKDILFCHRSLRTRVPTVKGRVAASGRKWVRIMQESVGVILSDLIWRGLGMAPTLPLAALRLWLGYTASPHGRFCP